MYITEKPAASTQTTFIWNRDYTSPSLPLCAFSLFLYLSLSKTYLSPSSLPFCLSLPFSRPVKTFLRGAFTLVPDTAKYLGCHRESASNQMARGFYTRILCVCVCTRAQIVGVVVIEMSTSQTPALYPAILLRYTLNKLYRSPNNTPFAHKGHS